MPYLFNYFLAVLPGIVWMSTCVLPALAGLVLARREFNRRNPSRGVVFVTASLASGLATLVLVGPFLLGTSQSSTDPLIWVWAPIFATGVLAGVIALGRGSAHFAK